MSGIDERFHEEWLGMVQPVEGLVVSIPVLVEAQCLSRQAPEMQQRLTELCPAVDGTGERAFQDVGPFLAAMLDWTPDLCATDGLPELYVPEGQQTLRPTLALRGPEGPLVLVWDLGPDCVGLPLDKPETKTGPWEYPPAAKFDRLLRHARVPIGLLPRRLPRRRARHAPHARAPRPALLAPRVPLSRGLARRYRRANQQ